MARRAGFLEELRLAGALFRKLNGFFIPPRGPEAELQRLISARENRMASFRTVLEQGVWGNPWSPYRRLLQWAGLDPKEVEELLRREGVEGTLGSLYEAGVYVTIDEFKGRRPLRRGSLEIPVEELVFDSPIPSGHLLLQTGGSGGRPVRLVLDLGLLELDTAGYSVFLDEWRLRTSPLVLWRPLPPGAAGVKRYLVHTRLRLRVAAWYAQELPGSWWTRIKSRSLVAGIILMARRATGLALPFPRHLALAEASRLAQVLAGIRASSGSFHCDTNVSSALRVVRAAAREGLDLSGGFFRVGGEPLTPARRQVFEEAGCSVGCNYSMAELGAVGHGCAAGVEPDEVHLRLDKVALLRRRVVRGGATIADALFLTSISPLAPKLMLNVCVGDRADVVERTCGCLFDQAGFTSRLSRILSFDKLASEGMHLMGEELVRLMEEILPRRFGGGPDHYQMAELDTPSGVRLEVRVDPTVGPLDEAECKDVVLAYLAAAAPENQLMVERWRQSGTLQVVRRPPQATGASKILTLRRESSGAEKTTSGA
jgi:hypothetical protein